MEGGEGEKGDAKTREEGKMKGEKVASRREEGEPKARVEGKMKGEKGRRRRRKEGDR